MVKVLQFNLGMQGFPYPNLSFSDYAKFASLVHALISCQSCSAASARCHMVPRATEIARSLNGTEEIGNHHIATSRLIGDFGVVLPPPIGSLDPDEVPFFGHQLS